ncbi:MAG: hypothetical protein IPL59_15005 [Candidatus Competibacteraceae bacterium]|nr:hypothetical protein [Candidatus Competibacteraceae bacterium]
MGLPLEVFPLVGCLPPFGGWLHRRWGVVCIFVTLIRLLFATLLGGVFGRLRAKRGNQNPTPPVGRESAAVVVWFGGSGRWVWWQFFGRSLCGYCRLIRRFFRARFSQQAKKTGSLFNLSTFYLFLSTF